MTSKEFATGLTLSIVGVLAVTSLAAAPAPAGDEHAHVGSANNALVKTVRQITEPYKNLAAAEAAGYALAFGCVTGPDAGGWDCIT